MEAIGIQKSYGKKKVLKDISFQAEKGMCTGFIGANGSGKSTLLRILAGVESADAGKILIKGNVAVGRDRKLMEKVGYVPQENALMEELSVRDNIMLFAALGNRKSDEKYIRELYERFSVTGFEKETVSRLSGGMKKRVSIICALINKPEILVMDEPSAALDLLFKEELKSWIMQFTHKGGSVLISSHDQGEIQICDKLYAMKDGRLQEVDISMTVEEMTAHYIK